MYRIHKQRTISRFQRLNGIIYAMSVCTALIEGAIDQLNS